MFFGPPYVELFGREHLSTAPAAHVAEIEDGIYLQVTRKPEDVIANYGDYVAGQNTLREYLDHGAFRTDTGPL